VKRVGAAVASLVVFVFPLLGATQGARATAPSAQASVFLIHGASFEEMMSVPEFRKLAAAGGAALLSHDAVAGRYLASAAGGSSGAGITVVDLGTAPVGPEAARAAFLDRAGRQVYATLAQVASGGQTGQALVVAVGRSPGMLAERDELGTLIYAPAGATGATGPMDTLTSDSTRRAGVVVGEDLLPTLASAGVSVGAAADSGSVIKIVDAPPPLGLHRRYLEHRRLTVPIGAAAGIYVTLVGLLGVVVLVGRAKAPGWLRSLSAYLAISVVSLAVALLEVGRLPTLSYGAVVPFLAGVTAAGTLALVPLVRRRGALEALFWLGLGVLVVLAVEAATGWPAAITPLLGGSQLDGGRFFGMPNVEIGLVLGAALFVARGLRSRVAGTVLLIACGLVAGLPWTGSNLGASVTLFAAAGFWWGLRGGRGWLWTAGTAAGTVIVGLALVLAAHRFLPGAPTHITRFTEASGGLGGMAGKVVDRLAVGLRLIGADPFAIIPVLGVPVLLFAVMSPAAPVRVTFDAHPEWRAAVLSILLASVVAYLANDSGAAALGLGFGTALGGLLYVSLLASRGMMEP